MTSIRSRLFYYYVKYQLAKSRRSNPTLAQRRANADQSGGRLPMPQNLVTEPIFIQGIEAEWLRPALGKSNGIVLYLHGGGYVFGSIKSHRRIAAHLALAAGSDILIFNYRLAPEFPFPAALDDALKVYCALLADYPVMPIALAGDSAGGGLALALALRLREQRMRAPVALALLSPWTDLSLKNASHNTKAGVDPYFPDKSILTKSAASYAADADLRHPLISPQFADLTHIPPTLIHVGDREALLDDACLLHQLLVAQGNDATLKIFHGMWHVWQLFSGIFPEADLSVAELGGYVRKHFIGPDSVDD
jgi:acetyl esterase/lipase